MAAGPSSAVASRPCSRTSASAPDRKIALTTPPRAVAARRPRAGVLVRRTARDATAAMAAGPVLFVSYSGVLGGAERILVDAATRAGLPAIVACPEGALATAARAAGLPVAT